jgi:hypothetical protein
MTSARSDDYRAIAEGFVASSFEFRLTALVVRCSASRPAPLALGLGR